MTAAAIDGIFALFRAKRHLRYGEGITLYEHAIQAGLEAEREGAAPALVAAALLHDIGYYLGDWPEDAAERGLDVAHENVGAAWLSQYFSGQVCDAVRRHVPAKRYLCQAEPGYWEGLSPASRQTLAVQGGPFTPEQAAEFGRQPEALAALALRRWDDAGKKPGLVLPDLEHFRPALEAALK